MVAMYNKSLLFFFIHTLTCFTLLFYLFHTLIENNKNRQRIKKQSIYIEREKKADK
jgi:CHASE3 domain sensor protein